MHIPQARIYKGYRLFAQAPPAPGGYFYSTVSIHRIHVSEPKYAPDIYAQGPNDDLVFIDEQEAFDNAEARGFAWIDAHPC